MAIRWSTKPRDGLPVTNDRDGHRKAEQRGRQRILCGEHALLHLPLSWVVIILCTLAWQWRVFPYIYIFCFRKIADLSGSRGWEELVLIACWSHLMAQLFALRLVQNQIKLARPSFPHSSSDKTQLSLDISGTGCSKRNGRGEKSKQFHRYALGFWFYTNMAGPSRSLGRYPYLHLSLYWIGGYSLSNQLHRSFLPGILAHSWSSVLSSL